MVSIWFFIGISLAVNGGLILAAGIYQLRQSPGESKYRALQLARECVVGCDIAADRGALLFQIRARETCLEFLVFRSRELYG